MASWQDILETEYKRNPEISHIDFINRYENLVPGPTRDAKIHKIKRKLERLKSSFSDDNKDNKNKKVEKVYENIFEPSIVDLDTKQKTITFGLIGDTHFNSKYCQITYLHKFYDLCKQQGITTIYHTGDIDDGENMRPGHAYENYTQGADEHINEIIKNYPCVEGIDTYFITGNHDASYRKHCGFDIGRQIEKERKDLHCLGRDLAIINITPKISMMLRHPWDGTAYALSYKPQKMIEAMDEDQRPTIMAVGHYHKLMYMYYLGVHCLQTGCFQSATPFTIGKGIRVSVGGWIITLHLDNEGNLISFEPKTVTFRTGIKDDYKNYNK